MVTAGVWLGSWHSTNQAFPGRFCGVLDGLHCIGVDVRDSGFG